jgi:hypothetical protein
MALATVLGSHVARIASAVACRGNAAPTIKRLVVREVRGPKRDPNPKITLSSFTGWSRPPMQVVLFCALCRDGTNQETSARYTMQ